MAIAFDPINKIIQLDSFNVSERQIWTAFVDWSVLSDNLKYGLGMSQIGGFVPIALYIYLDLGWKIRPLEANGITTISGNLIVEGGGSPISATVGNWQTLVNMETPVKAVALDSGGSSSGGASIAEIQAIIDNLNNFDPSNQEVIANGLAEYTAITLPKITEIHKIQGLDASNPLVTTESSMESGDIKINITGNGETLSEFTRE